MSTRCIRDAMRTAILLAATVLLAWLPAAAADPIDDAKRPIERIKIDGSSCSAVFDDPVAWAITLVQIVRECATRILGQPCATLDVDPVSAKSLVLA